MLRRIFFLIVLFIWLTSSCTPDSPTLIPIATVTLTASPNPTSIPAPTQEPTSSSPTETPLPPESILEKAARMGFESGMRQETTSDPNTWADDYYRGLYDNMAKLTVEQQAELHAYLDGKYEGYFVGRYLESPARLEQGRNILMNFALGLEQDPAMKEKLQVMDQTQLKEYLHTLSDEQHLGVEIVRTALEGEKIIVSAQRMIYGETHNKVTYHEAWDNGKLTDTGMYGIWRLNKLDYSTAYIGDRIYTIPTFGQPVERRGAWFNEELAMDFIGIGVLPGGHNTITGIMKDANGHLKDENGKYNLVFIQLAMDSNPEIKFDSESQYIGGYEGLGALTPTTVLHTRYAVDRANWASDFSPLTEDVLKDNLSWPPKLIIVRPPNEHFDNKVEHMFFAPDTGLPVLGNSAERNKIDTTSVIFISPNNGYNVWPAVSEVE